MESHKESAGFSKGVMQLMDASFGGVRRAIEGNVASMENMFQVIDRMSAPSFLKSKDDCGCCPPKHKCPPRCLLNITRTAFAGERIVVQFKVKNTHCVAKHYRVGIRPLKDENGNIAPRQPGLSKAVLQLDPGETQAVALTLDLANFGAGHEYKADIVIREKDVNQNICFTLVVKPQENMGEAEPRDENKPTLVFHDWTAHFYCEPSRGGRQVPVDKK